MAANYFVFIKKIKKFFKCFAQKNADCPTKIKVKEKKPQKLMLKDLVGRILGVFQFARKYLQSTTITLTKNSVCLKPKQAVTYSL